MKSFDQFKSFMDVLKVENDAIGPLKKDLLKQLNLDFEEEFKTLSLKGQWQILKEFILWMEANFKKSKSLNEDFSEVGWWFATFLGNLFKDKKTQKVKITKKTIAFLWPLINLKAKDIEQILDEKVELEILKLLKEEK